MAALGRAAVGYHMPASQPAKANGTRVVPTPQVYYAPLRTWVEKDGSPRRPRLLRCCHHHGRGDLIEHKPIHKQRLGVLQHLHTVGGSLSHMLQRPGKGNLILRRGSLPIHWGALQTRSHAGNTCCGIATPAGHRPAGSPQRPGGARGRNRRPSRMRAASRPPRQSTPASAITGESRWKAVNVIPRRGLVSWRTACFGGLMPHGKPAPATKNEAISHPPCPAPASAPPPRLAPVPAHPQPAAGAG